jgi:hypothetical protein
MAAVPDEVRHRPRTKHSLDDIGFKIDPDRPARLDDLMSDYVTHLVHHVEQVLGKEWAGTDVKQ